MHANIHITCLQLPAEKEDAPQGALESAEVVDECSNERRDEHEDCGEHHVAHGRFREASSYDGAFCTTQEKHRQSSQMQLIKFCA